jgi:hypothetical protein
VFCLDATVGVYGAFKRSCCVYPLVEQLVGHSKILIVLKCAHPTQVHQARSVERMEQFAATRQIEALSLKQRSIRGNDSVSKDEETLQFPRQRHFGPWLGLPL